jgi:phospholipase A1
MRMKSLVQRSSINVPKRLLIFLLFTLPFIAHSQSGITKDSARFLIEKSPAFSIYKDNYFITGVPLNEKPTVDNSDVKFQFSFKLRMINKPLFWGTYMYLTYSQKSFWDIYKLSSPFSETNYNPGFRLSKPMFMNHHLAGVLSLSAEHESNGRDSLDSRSWNWVALTYSHLFRSHFMGSLKVFAPFGLEDNPDLMDYVGYSEAQLSWTIKENKLILDVVGRKVFSWNNHGNLMTSISYRPFKSRNYYLMLQWWQGYAESLIDYTQSTSMLRLGIVIKPSYLRFY